jgi:hypothetical protein
MSCLRIFSVLTVLFVVMQPLAAEAGEGEVRLRSIKDVSIDELIDDTQYTTDDPDRMTMAWWLPDEFWSVSLVSDPTMTEAGVAEILELVSGYTLVIYVDGEFGPFGGVKFVLPEQLRRGARLVGVDGEEVSPLADAEVSPDMVLLVGAMRPVIANMLGAFGENMSFVVFPREDSEGRVIADATAGGGFTMKLGEASFKVHTPLPALLAGKRCGVCEREYRGDYVYCPYDRAELAYTVSE